MKGNYSLISGQQSSSVIELEDFYDDDWYVSRPRPNAPRLFNRSQMLTLVFVIKGNLRLNSKIDLPAYKTCLESARIMGFDRIRELDDIPWETLRFAIKAMKKKYNHEKDHDKFERFVAEARAMWRLDNNL